MNAPRSGIEHISRAISSPRRSNLTASTSTLNYGCESPIILAIMRPCRGAIALAFGPLWFTCSRTVLHEFTSLSGQMPRMQLIPDRIVSTSLTRRGINMAYSTRRNSLPASLRHHTFIFDRTATNHSYLVDFYPDNFQHTYLTCYRPYPRHHDHRGTY